MRTSPFDEDRTEKTTCNAISKCRVKDLLVTDQCIELHSIGFTLDLRKTTFYWIVHDALGYRKVAVQLAPKELD